MEMNSRMNCLALGCLLVVSVACDPVVDWLKSRIDIHKGSSKLWYSYVKSFLFRALTVTNDSCKSYKSHLTEILIKSVDFETYDSALEPYKHLKAQLEYQFWTKVDPSRQNSDLVRSAQLEAKNASGDIVIDESVQACPYHDFDIQSHCDTFVFTHFVMHFSLDERLSLNLTFLTLDFIGGSVNYAHGSLQCDFGRAVVKSSSQYFHTFCGQQSIFGVYSSSPNVSLHVYVHPATQFLIWNRFMIQDCCFFVSTRKITLTNPQLFLLSSFRSQNSTSMMYKIQVRKIQILILNTTNTQAEALSVADGPGFSSNHIEAQHNIYTFSTFQGVVLVLCKFGMCDNNSFVYTVISSRYVTLILSTTQKYFLPKPNLCSYQSCLLEIKAENMLQINVSVKQISFSGYNEETCIFGGLTFLRFNAQFYDEGQILCKSQKHGFKMNRSFYSFNHSIFVYMFWYSGFSTISTSLVAELTGCKSVQLCPCTLMWNFLSVGGIGRSMAYIQHKLSVKRLLSTVILSCIDCSARGSGVETAELDVTLEDTCLILQIARNRSCSPKMYARNVIGSTSKRVSAFSLLIYGTIVSSPQTGKHSELDVEVRGVLRETNSRYQCRFDCGGALHLTFGFTDQFVPLDAVNGREIYLKDPGGGEMKEGPYILYTEGFRSMTWLEIKMQYTSVEGFFFNLTRTLWNQVFWQ